MNKETLTAWSLFVLLVLSVGLSGVNTYVLLNNNPNNDFEAGVAHALITIEQNTRTQELVPVSIDDQTFVCMSQATTKAVIERLNGQTITSPN